MVGKFLDISYFYISEWMLLRMDYHWMCHSLPRLVASNLWKIFRVLLILGCYCILQPSKG